MAVVAALLESEEGILLTRRRPDAPDFPDHWEFPGGKIEPGETEAQALERELFEELGVRVRVEGKVTELYEARPNGPDIDFRVIACQLVEGAPRPIEVAEVRWFQLDEIGDLLLPPLDRRVLATLIDTKNSGAEQT